MNKKQQKYVTKSVLMSPYSLNLRFVQSKTSQKIVQGIDGVVEAKGLQELKKNKDVVVGLKGVNKLLKSLGDEPKPDQYYVFALKYAEVAEMMKNLPIACKIAKQQFFYFPKFIGERISKVFKVKVRGNLQRQSKSDL